MVWYTFKTKPRKVSNGSLVMTIPKFFVRQGFLTANNEYVFAIRVDNSVKVPAELDDTPHIPQPTATTLKNDKLVPVSLATPLQSGSDSDDGDDVVEDKDTYSPDDEYE